VSYRPHNTEGAFLLLFVNAVDLFGGYTFNIALSRRMFDVGASPPARLTRGSILVAPLRLRGSN
jgi:hypothetical protein